MDQFLQGNEIEDDASISLDNSRANWTPSQDQYFLELLLSHVHKGNKTGKVFTRLAWADMTEQFNNKFGFKYDLEVLKNRYKRFKKQYYEIKAMVSQNGFQWDATLNMITANDKTWDEYIKLLMGDTAFHVLTMVLNMKKMLRKKWMTILAPVKEWIIRLPLLIVKVKSTGLQ